MRRYLSFGGGVDSTALLILMTRQLEAGTIEPFEAVFVDHGADYPETYAHVEALVELGYQITTIKPSAYEGYASLLTYCQDTRLVPVRTMRWCTDHFKIRPLYDYFETPCEVAIGIDADEEHRAKDARRPGITNVFPLVELGLGRADCERIIRDAGLTVPKKSGCWFCPFQSRRQWVELERNYPELWCKALALEAANVAYARERDQEPFYFRGRPLAELVRAKGARGRYVAEDQDGLFDDRRPCQCGL